MSAGPRPSAGGKAGHPDAAPAAGSVDLVGAGPGDPDLLTVGGLRALEAAEVVIYDRLVDPRILRHVRPQAERVFAGKSPADEGLGQAAINDLLIERARRGLRVCRLKGGDPFVFGRGGEEAEALAAAGVPFSVIPGVSSAVAAPAYAGIPVTHRGVSSSLAILTAREGADGEAPGAEPVALPADTLVVLMGVERLPELVARLLRQGRPPETPAAVIESGTLPCQRTVAGTLADIGERAREAGIAPPAVAVFGEVVRLRERIRWFDARPLFGRRVILARAADQAEELGRTMASLGADVIEFATIRIEALPAPPLQLLDAEWDWAVFTSANGPRHLSAALLAVGRDVRRLGRARIVAVGAATAAAVERLGLRVDFVPRLASAEGLADEFPGPVRGQRILLIRARQGRELLPETLRRRGAEVAVLPVYVTVPDGSRAAEVAADLASRPADAIILTSSSTARFTRQLLPDLDPASLRAICIGAVTAATAAECGFLQTWVADEPTPEALVRALLGSLTSPSCE